MPFLALALMVVAAVSHASWNALTKRTPQRFVLLWLAMFLGSPIAIATAGLVSDAPLIPQQGRGLLLLSSLVHAGYFYALSRAYRADLSLAYPLARGLAVGLAPIGAWLWLGERVSLAGSLGIGCVVAGGIWVGVSERVLRAVRRWRVGETIKAELSAADKEQGALANSGVRWALLGGLLVASYSLIDAQGGRLVHPLVYAAWMGFGSALAMLPLMWSRRADAYLLLRTQRAVVFAVAVLSLGTYVLVLTAFRLAATGYVVACRELSIVASVLLGSLWLGEPHGRSRLVGGVVIVCGAAIITLLG